MDMLRSKARVCIVITAPCLLLFGYATKCCLRTMPLPTQCHGKLQPASLILIGRCYTFDVSNNSQFDFDKAHVISCTYRSESVTASRT